MESIDSGIFETVNNIWTAILGLEVSRGAQAMSALSKVETERTITSCVQLAGAWEGSVLLYCTAKLARRMASVMFGMSEEDLGNDEIEDAMGELGNMVAGNIKILLPKPCELSLPTVVDGLDYRLIVPRSLVYSKLLLECEGEPLLVTLLEREENGKGARHSSP